MKVKPAADAINRIDSYGDGKVYTVGQVALICRVTNHNVTTWCRQKQLKTFPARDGRQRIWRDDLLDFLRKYCGC